MISLTINSQPNELPTHWDELKFWHYREILESGQDTEWEQLIAKFLKLDFEQFKTATLVGFEPVIQAMSFMATPPQWNLTNPSKVGQFILPANITLETVIQYEHMKKIAFQQKPFVELVKDYPLMVAIYCQKVRDGEYSYQKAQELATDMENYNAKEVIEAANFFLAKLILLRNGFPANSQTNHQTPKKQSLVRSWLDSAFNRFLTIWRKLPGKRKPI